MKPILHLDDVELEQHAHGEKFEARDGTIAERVGAKLLGYSLTVVPPGKRAWPFHNHHVNEEMFFILEGTGVVRIGAEEHAVRAGHVIACPPGDASTAHQLVNTGEVDLRYLSVSTALPHEIVEYPDSGKVMIRAADAAGAPRRFYYRGDLKAPREYWDGE